MRNIIEIIGGRIISLTQHIIGVSNLFLETLKWILIGPFKKESIRAGSVLTQMSLFAGTDSVLVVFFVAMVTGIIVAMQAAYQLAQLGEVIYVAGIVSVSIVRELGPVLTALLVAGRAGSAMAAELSTMKVSKEVEAVGDITFNPVRFLVVPRFLALLVVLPCLTITSNLAGMTGGFILGVMNLKIEPGLYIDTSFRFLKSRDILTGIVKSAVFAMTIAVIGCYEGLNAKGGTEAVGRSATLSVVVSFILIILFDCVLTAFFYFSQI